jgi:exosortase
MSDLTPVISESAEGDATRQGARWAGIALQVVVIAALLWFVYERPIHYIVAKWLTDENWSHGFLVPVFSLYFLGVHRREIFSAPRRTNLLGLVVLLASLGIYALFFLKRIGYPQHLSIVTTLLGLVLFLGGWQVLKKVWLPICYLVFAIPIPGSIYFYLTLPLRKISSKVAGTVLGMLPDVYTQVQGVVIEYQHGSRVSSLNVDEACSGMRLLVAFCALGVAVAYLADRPLWQRVVLVAFCIPIAIFCNMVRIFVTGVLSVYGYESWARGTAHGLLGLLMLLVALGLFGLVGYVLSHLFVDAPDDADEDAAAMEQ